MRIGAHVPRETPLEAATVRGADVAQFFLSEPQSYRKPDPRSDAEQLRASDVAIYVHAPYLMNPASPNNRIRIPSRKTIAQTMEAAVEVGAEGVIVHGGHVGDDEDISVGFDRWRKLFEYAEDGGSMPILVENTAGGGNAVARELAGYGPLWEAVGDFNVGVCLDTCHAWAAGEDLETAVDTLRAATGRLDLVHCNNSRDPHNSRRDRHANLGAGEISEALLLAVVRDAGSPVVVETPDGDGGGGQAADIAWLREHI